MNIIESVEVAPPPPTPVRRVTFELPVDRAEALRKYLGALVWAETPSLYAEFSGLHEALGGWDGDFIKEAS